MSLAELEWRNPWDTSVPDWEARIMDQRSLIPELPLFQGEAERALRIFKRLKVPDIIGNPTYGESCDEWVFDFVRALFGSYDPATNRRMIREFFLLVPKKNGKSSIAAAIMVTAAIINRRPEAELLLIAPTKKIANIAFKQAAGIIRLDKELSKLFLPQGHQRTITHRNTLAVILIQAADTDVITGSKSTFILIDETHVFAKKSKAADIFVEIRGALAARPDGFLLQITTQSKEPPTGVFKAELTIARLVRDGKMSLPLLAVLYELPLRVAKDGGWKDPKTWPLVNPNLGRSVDEAFLRDELLKAEYEGMAALTLLASQHFNVEIGLAQQSDGWAGAEFWLGNPRTGASNVDATLTLKELIRRSEVIVIGIDGGGLDDLLGLAVLGREAEETEIEVEVDGVITKQKIKRLLLWCRAWAHEIVKERRKEIAPKLDELAGLKQLTFVKLPGQDVYELAEIVVEIDRSGLLAEENAIGVDSFGVAAITTALTGENRGIAKERIVGISQGWKLNGAIKGAERDLAGGAMIHPGQEIMNFAVANARIVPHGNAVSIDKQVSGSAKIDPLMAALHAKVLMGLNPQAGRSIYEERGLRIA